MNGVRLVTFDITNCLIRKRRPISLSYSEAAAIFGLQLHPHQQKKLDLAFRKAYREVDSRFPCFGACNGTSERDWWRQIVVNTFRYVGVSGQVESLHKIYDHLYRTFSTPAEWKLDNEAVEVLQSLYRSGVKLGAISNWDIRLEKLLHSLKILDWFHFLVLSHQEKVAKPMPEVFDIAEAAAGKYLDAPHFRHLWLHVGSHWRNDIFGARRAGIGYAVYYNCDPLDKTRRPDEMTGMEGTFEVERLSDVTKYL